MKTYIQILKIGLISTLIIILTGFSQILYAVESDTETTEETRKQRRIERQSSLDKSGINTKTLSDKIITEEFREKRQEILKQQEFGEITQEQARIILTEERKKLENKTTEINSVSINTQNNRVFLKDDSNFQMRKNNAGKKIRLENQEKRKQNEEKRKVEMEEIKDEFEKYRTQILDEVKDGTLSIKDARTQLYNFRNTTILDQREKYKTEREKEKLEHKTRVNYLIIKQLSEKFSKYDTLSNQEKLEKYNNVLLNINNKLKDSNLSEKQKILLQLLKNIVINKKEELS